MKKQAWLVAKNDFGEKEVDLKCIASIGLGLRPFEPEGYIVV